MLSKRSWWLPLSKCCAGPARRSLSAGCLVLAAAGGVLRREGRLSGVAYCRRLAARCPARAPSIRMAVSRTDSPANIQFSSSGRNKYTLLFTSQTKKYSGVLSRRSCWPRPRPSSSNPPPRVMQLIANLWVFVSPLSVSCTSVQLKPRDYPTLNWNVSNQTRKVIFQKLLRNWALIDEIENAVKWFPVHIHAAYESYNFAKAETKKNNLSIKMVDSSSKKTLSLITMI